MLAFVLASLIISTAAAPSPYVEPASIVSASIGAPSVGWWNHHGHPKWLSAWPSHHRSHHHPHHTSGGHHSYHASGSATSVVTVSATHSSAAATNSNSASASPSSSAPAYSTHSASTPATTSTPSSASSSSKVPPSSSAKPTVSAGASPANASLSPSAAAYLDPHNTMRAKHSAKPLVWSDDLANAAQTWANGCKWAHSKGAVGAFGENIAAGTGNFNATGAVAAWASEESQYNPAQPTYSHFTQMVWKATTQIGCSVATCPGLINSDVAQFHVCEYSVPGNVEGQSSANVS